MGSPRIFWVAAVVILPTIAPLAATAQTSGGKVSGDLGRNDRPPENRPELGLRKSSRRARSRSSQPREDRSATNDWNPHYLAGKEYFVQGYYDKALTELTRNVADCDHIDFELMGRQNDYFEHIWNCIPSMGQNPHAFIRSSNLQWVGAALAALGQYELAETRFVDMESYAQKCFPDRMSTFEGCACQGLAFLLATRGQYTQAADRYRLALAHIEGNQAQIGLPPAPCVAMILVALADVELAAGRLAAAEQSLKRAERIQESQRQLRLGPAPLDRAALLTVLAQLRVCQQRQSEGYNVYAESIAIMENIRKDHPLTACCLEGLAEIDLERGRLDQSEDHFRKSLTVRRVSLGESHRDIAFSLDGLARVASARGDLDQAKLLSNEACAIMTRESGPSHPDFIKMLARNRGNARNDDKRAPFRARFLALPTFLTVGWQVLHLGKDWRVVEANILWREVKEAKTVHHAAAPPRQRGAGND